MAAESEKEEYYNGKKEKLKNRKTKRTKVKRTKSQSDETKSESDDYSPEKIFRFAHKPELDFEAARDFPCNTLFDFFNLVDSSSDKSEEGPEGTFPNYRVSKKGYFSA